MTSPTPVPSSTFLLLLHSFGWIITEVWNGMENILSVDTSGTLWYPSTEAFCLESRVDSGLSGVGCSIVWMSLWLDTKEPLFQSLSLFPFVCLTGNLKCITELLSSAALHYKSAYLSSIFIIVLHWLWVRRVKDCGTITNGLWRGCLLGLWTLLWANKKLIC